MWHGFPECSAPTVGFMLGDVWFVWFSGDKRSLVLTARYVSGDGGGRLFNIGAGPAMLHRNRMLLHRTEPPGLQVRHRITNNISS